MRMIVKNHKSNDLNRHEIWKMWSVPMVDTPNMIMHVIMCMEAQLERKLIT
jgi:hypothetical protein